MYVYIYLYVYIWKPGNIYKSFCFILVQNVLLYISWESFILESKNHRHLNVHSAGKAVDYIYIRHLATCCSPSLLVEEYFLMGSALHSHRFLYTSQFSQHR